MAEEKKRQQTGLVFDTLNQWEYFFLIVSKFKLFGVNSVTSYYTNLFHIYIKYNDN